MIVKIIDSEDDEKGLKFDSYRHTFSPRSIGLAKSLNLNREVWFNFDIDSSEKWEAVKTVGFQGYLSISMWSVKSSLISFSRLDLIFKQEWI